MGWRYAMMASVSSAGCDRRGAGFRTDQRDEPRREFGLADELPGTGHAGEPVTAPGGQWSRAKLFQRGFDVAFLGFFEGFGFVAVLVETSKSRCSLGVGFCAEKRMASRMYLGSMFRAATGRAGAKVISISPKSSG